MELSAAHTTKQKSAFWTTESKLAYMLLFPALAVLICFILYPILYVFMMAFFETDELGKISTSYNVTEQVIESLRREGLPEDILEKIPLSKKAFKKERQFVRVLKRKLGAEDAKKYQDIIIQHAQRKFIGLENFSDLFKNKAFWEVTRRSILWTFLGVSSKTVVGLIIALLLNIEFKGRKIYRTLVIIPWASSVPISAMLWQWVFNSEFGLLNYTLKLMGFENPPLWLAYPTPAFFANLYVDIWIGIPFMAMVFLAGLQAIPKDIYESAEVDGASAFTSFWKITLPMLKKVLLVATLLSSLWTFNDFNVIYILTKGGPVNKTDILITFIYKYSFQFLKFGPAAAMAIITFAILLTVSLVYARYYFRSEEL